MFPLHRASMPAGRFRTAALSMKSYSSTPSAIKRVSLIPGDGIGPEIAAAVQRIFFVAKVPIEWDLVNVTPIIGEDGKTSLSPEALASFHSTRIGLKGPLATPIGTGHVSLNLLLRNMPNLETRYRDVDTVIVRENTEGEYSGIEHLVVPGVAQSIKLITEKASRRVSEFAFQYARDIGRPNVIVVHKATIIKASEKYPDIAMVDMSLDKACLQV
ncbi:subunit alpha of isocitrate dehydrogenase [Mitosporidium daphniae]|uniref:Subunit alpha of isocitrate dehydrogenase n=1 Tax=Mitosporidium daphniae TaxID=1485682 RepID=A0A098VUF0_9MICR|nr:subunit alpha of isocitrate dehydrogenase [Mitosporidium daphniae]KGG51306.1 subunit alpha of isocitrate dehydrogenase [Mitosporidium daphniae]|eukprot:XP_013237733.1 subunit alpha of isocitrate dehydrogenase [Mitosporidium daphniae]